MVNQYLLYYKFLLVPTSLGVTLSLKMCDKKNLNAPPSPKKNQYLDPPLQTSRHLC